MDFSPYASYSAAMDDYRAICRDFAPAGKPDQIVLDRAIEFVERACLTGRIVDDERERADLQSAVNYWSTVILRYTDHDIVDSVLKPFDESQAPNLSVESCPYVGLRPFALADQDLFAGRSVLIADLVADVLKKNLVLLTGTSGSGKSSVILAGVIPALQAGEAQNSKNWRFLVPFVPGAQPIDSFARALTGKGREDGSKWFKFDEGPEWADKAADNLAANPSGIVALLGEGTVCIVVDQFEETFTSCKDETTRTAFLKIISAAARAGHKCILTMRSEFLEDNSVSLPNDFRAAVFSLDERVLKAQEIREMIEVPAGKIGLKIDQEVITDIVSRLSTVRSALPILQITLMELWDKKRRNRVTYESYLSDVGNPLSLLDKVAERTYQSLPRESQAMADAILMRLVQPGPLEQTVSNRVSRAELKGLGAEANVNAALKALVEARLVRRTAAASEASADMYEIAHEAIVRNWERLTEMVATSRDNMKDRLRLSAMVEAWNAQERAEDLFLSGGTLAWASSLTGLNESEREFIALSKEHSEKGDKRRRFKAWGALGLYGVLALIGFTVSWLETNQKEHEKDQALIRQGKELSATLKKERDLAEKRLKELEAKNKEIEGLKQEQIADINRVNTAVATSPNKMEVKIDYFGRRLTSHEYIVWHSLQAPGDPTAEALIRYDVVGRGYSGPAHHLYVNLKGSVVAGRNIDYQGSHVRGLNDRSIGILFNGDGTEQGLNTPQMETAMSQTIALMKRYGIPSSKVIGHDEAITKVRNGQALKNCPGPKIDMAEIRAMIDRRLGQGRAPDDDRRFVDPRLNEQKPADPPNGNEQKPIGREQKAVDGEQKPLDRDRKPREGEQKTTPPEQKQSPPVQKSKGGGLR